MSHSSSEEKCKQEETEVKEKVKGKLFQKKVCYHLPIGFNNIFYFKARMVINTLHMVHTASAKKESNNVNEKKDG